MAEITAITARIVQRPRNTTATPSPVTTPPLKAPCPNCGGRGRELSPLRLHGPRWPDRRLRGFSITKIPGWPQLPAARGRAVHGRQAHRPFWTASLQGRLAHVAELKLVRDDELNNWKMEFTSAKKARKAEESGEAVDFQRPGIAG